MIKIIILIHIINCYHYGIFHHNYKFNNYLSSLYIVVSLYTFNSNFTPESDNEIIFFCFITLSSILVFAFL